MDRRRFGFTLAFCAVFVMAIAAAFVLSSMPSEDRDEEEGAAEGVPPALARHIEDLKKAIPGSGGESGEGPGGAGALELAIRAYPDSDIPLARIQAANAAFQAVRGRGFPSGKDRSGTWVSIGPSEAVYPFFGPRNSGLYVPNEYSAASRINAMAIGPICAPRHCTLWVAAAGGGI